MACALFAYVGAVTKSVVTSSFTCEWETTAQWAQALTEEGLLAVLEEFAKDKDPIEGFAEDEDPIVEAIAELHHRLLTDEGALRLVPTARAAATILRSLRRAVALASSEQILARQARDKRERGEAGEEDSEKTKHQCNPVVSCNDAPEGDPSANIIGGGTSVRRREWT